VTRTILGIDPGLTRCGFGVVCATGQQLRFIEAGVIKTAAGAPIEQRLLAVWNGLTALIEQHRPDAVAVERVYAQLNVRTVMGTAQASGLALTVATLHGISVATYTPTEMKAAVTGSGRAEKAQVMAMAPAFSSMCAIAGILMPLVCGRQFTPASRMRMIAASAASRLQVPEASRTA